MLLMSVDLDVMLDELDTKIEKLKIKYEQYLIGVERFEPIKERKEIDRSIRLLQSQIFSRTAHRFKFHGLIQRFVTYQHYWNRCQRQIEEGTFRRDLARIQRDLKRKGIDDGGLLQARTKTEVEAALARSVKSNKTVEADAARVSPEASASASVKEANVVKKSTSHPPPIPTDASGQKKASENGMRQLYNALLAARRRTGEPVEGLTFEKLSATVMNQIERIRKAHGCHEVEFTVEIKGGRALLKVKPKM